MLFRSAGNNTLILPGGNGTADQVLGGNGSGTLNWVDRGRMTLATAQNTTSGTAIDFTGIPSWVKRVTVMFNGVSTNGSSSVLIQLGTSGGVESTGYSSTAVATDATVSSTTGSTIGALIVTQTASDAKHGQLVFSAIGSNVWVFSGQMRLSATQTSASMGSKSLSGTLDRVRLTTVNGTDTFDAGSANILYEG